MQSMAVSYCTSFSFRRCGARAAHFCSLSFRLWFSLKRVEEAQSETIWYSHFLYPEASSRKYSLCLTSAPLYGEAVQKHFSLPTAVNSLRCLLVRCCCVCACTLESACTWIRIEYEETVCQGIGKSQVLVFITFHSCFRRAFTKLLTRWLGHCFCFCMCQCDFKALPYASG